MSVDRGYVESNARSRERLERLSERGDVELAVQLPGGWTVAVVFAHLAFWDGWAGARWDQYERDGSFEDLPGSLQELANRAAMPQWLALPPRRALTLAMEAAERLDARLEKLPDEAIARVLETGRQVMVDRSLHRGPHLDEIEQALKGSS
jgi:Mycothiol maleylpyruvate isomerase N-terminal domain